MSVPEFGTDYTANGVVVRYIGRRLPAVMEPIPHTYSLSFAVWLLRGSRDEGPEEHGLAHFLEHMFFKGTRRRTTYEIARLLDRIGGRVDAFTTKEYVCFYARVLRDHQPLITDLFADLVLNAVFDPNEMEKERQVILEELRGAEDDPQEFASDRFMEAIWPGHGLGRPVGGFMKDILKVRHETLMKHFRRQLYPENLLITASGSLDPDKLFRDLEEKFEPILAFRGEPAPRTPPRSSRFAHIWQWPHIEQVHVLIGGPGLSFVDERRFAFSLALNVLGSGMSSRLFMKLREEQGLVYNTHASALPLSDTGLWYVYAGTAPERLPRVVEVLRNEIARMREGSLTREELDLAKQQVRANALMSWESASERMFARAKQFVYREDFIDVEERVRRIEKIPLEEVHRVASELLREERLSILVLGNLDDRRVPSVPWPEPFRVFSKSDKADGTL